MVTGMIKEALKMGELSIQGFTPVQYQGTVRTQRSAPAEQSQGVSRAGFTVSETLDRKSVV